MENERDETIAKKSFSSLPPQLRELVRSKTDTATRLKLFQINNELRGWVLKKELFGEDLNEIQIRGTSGAQITPRYDPCSKIDLSNQYVFKVVRRCKELYLDNQDSNLDLRSIFPRLKSVNCLEFCGTNLASLIEWFKWFKGSDVEVTGFSVFPESWHWGANWKSLIKRTSNLDEKTSNLDQKTSNLDENFFQFIENHLKRCKTVYFGEYPLEKLFDLLGRQHFLQTIFKYKGYGWKRGLEMILKNGIPSLHPDPAILMTIESRKPEDSYEAFFEIFNMISERTSVLMENEAIRKKFPVSKAKVGGSLNDCNRQFFGLKRKFDEKRNLIFLVYKAVKHCGSSSFDIHIKFDPIVE